MEKLIYQKKNEFNIKYFFYDISSHKFILWKLNIKFEKFNYPSKLLTSQIARSIPKSLESWNHGRREEEVLASAHPHLSLLLPCEMLGEKGLLEKGFKKRGCTRSFPLSIHRKTWYSNVTHIRDRDAKSAADFPGIKFTIADSGLHEGNRRTSLILGESHGCRERGAR